MCSSLHIYLVPVLVHGTLNPSGFVRRLHIEYIKKSLSESLTVLGERRVLCQFTEEVICRRVSACQEDIESPLHRVRILACVDECGYGDKSDGYSHIRH